MRTFFALWPPPSAKPTLATRAREFAQRCGGRATRPERLHLTLVFLGSTPESLLPTLLARTDEISVPAFQLAFDVAGAWRRNGIAWTASEQVPEPLSSLQRELAQRVHDLGFKIEKRSFFPHITLARGAKVELGPTPVPPILCDITEFSLVQSHFAPLRYSILAWWKLTL